MRKLIIIIGVGAGMLLASRAFPSETCFFDGPDMNPALYALRGETRIDFLSARAGAGNNTFSLGDYSLYNGVFLTDADKMEILQSVPGAGLATTAYAYAGMGAVMRGDMCVAGGARAGENSTMPRDVLDLVLHGNEIGRTYSMDGASGEAMALVDMSFAYSMPVNLAEHSFFAGARFHLLKGLAYGGVVDAGGSLRTDEASLSGEGEIVTRTAGGGSGFSLDIGMAHKTYSQIIIHTYMLNVVSTLQWTQDCKQEINGVIAEDIAFGAADLDSLVNDFHETKPVDGFSTSIAPIMGVSVEKATRWAYLSVLYTQGFRQGAFTSGKPRVAIRGSWQSVWFMDVSAGLAYESGFGFDERVEIGFGRSPRAMLGARFSPLPYGSAIRQFEVSMGLSYRM